MDVFKLLIAIIIAPTLSFSQDMNQIRQQQIHSYEKQHWDQFFGVAIGYRKYLYSAQQNNNLIFLEALALIRHCHFDLAINLMNSLSLSELKLSDKDKNKIEKTLNLIPGIRNIPLNKRSLLKDHLLTKSNRWKLIESNKSIPLGAYRSHVENLCKK